MLEYIIYYIYVLGIHVKFKLTRRRVCRTTVMVWPVVEVQLSREQCGENIVRVVRITTRHTFQINRGARYWTPGRKTSTLLRKGCRHAAVAMVLQQWWLRRYWCECGVPLGEMVVTFIEICLGIICSTVNGGGGERSNRMIRKKTINKNNTRLWYI